MAPATCESAGSHDLVTRCTVCNEVLETKTVNVEALGHTWNNGAVTKAPTCTEPGTRTYTCARDASHTRTEAVPATGHIAGEPAHENEAPATCTDAGSYDLVTRCTSCGELLSSEHVAVPATGHKWGEYVPDGNATCESDGTKTAQCVNGCGASDTVDDVGSALGHDWDEGTVTKQPTCTAEGVMTYACKRDKSHTRAEAVPATGHVPGGPAPENVAPATCESAGSHDLVTRCSACGELLSSEHVTVPALGHDWDEGAVAKAPTCTEAGVKTFTCKNDPSHKRDEAIPATGHEWGAGVVTRQPTATEEGVRTYTCATCGQTREEAVPKAQPTDISAAEVSGLADAVYTGKAVEPDPRVTLGGATLVRGVDYALSYKGNVNAGTATVTVTGIGNYAGTKAAIFKIAPKKATPTVTLSKASYVYDGSAKKPSVTVKVGGTKLSSSSYTVAYASGRKAVGTYKVTVKLKGNYTGTKAVTFKITPKKATPTVTLSKTSYAYDGKAKKPSVTVKVGKTKLSSSSYTVTYASGRKAVGTYKVTVKLKGNYAGTKAATFKVTQAANTATAKKTSVSASFTVAQLKSKAQTVALPGVTAKFGTAKWKVTAKDAKGVLSLKSGKVQVKKGAKAGAYTIKLKASVAATKNYKAASTKVVTVKVTVKAKASTALKAQSDGTALAAGTMAL